VNPAELIYRTDLPAATRLVLYAVADDPDATIPELVERLGLDRRTVQRSLTKAEAAGVIRRGSHLATERGPITWETSIHAAPHDTPDTSIRAAPSDIRAAPQRHSRRPPEPLPGMESSCREVGQRQGRTPPTPPLDSPPSPEPASATTASELREAISKVRRLRRENGLATGIAYDRDIGRVLVSVLGQAHREGLTATLDDVAEAAGVALVVTVPAIVVTLNRKVAPSAVTGGRRHVAREDAAALAENAAAVAAWDPKAIIAELRGG
jgi:hypothetical protein